MMRVRIVIADDHALFRAGMRMLLRACEDIQVVAEASDGHAALALAREHRPHVLLMDIGMPGLNGVEAAERVRRELPETRVIILPCTRARNTCCAPCKRGRPATC